MACARLRLDLRGAYNLDNPMAINGALGLQCPTPVNGVRVMNHATKCLLGIALLGGCSSTSSEMVGTDPWGMTATETEGASMSGTDGGDGSSGTDDGTDPQNPQDVDCDAGPHVAEDDLVRLTLRQYDATVFDLLGLESDVARTSFSADVLLTGSADTRFKMGAPVSSLVAKQLMLGSETLAAQVDVPMLSDGCDGGEGCVENFLVDFARRGFRRPARPQELAALREIYDGEADHDAGTRAVVEAVLQSPQFLYLTLADTSGAEPGEVVALDDYAIASRLSYFVWGTMPDEALFAAADAGELSTAEGIEGQLERMLDDARAEHGVLEFYDAVIDLDFVATVTKNPDAYPDFTTDIAQDLHTSLTMALRSLHFDGDGTLGDLAQSMPLYANDRLAAYYGLEGGAGESFEPVAEQGGLLSHPGLASLLAKPTETAIVERGQFVRAALLCSPLPPPPPGVEAELPEEGEWDTPRERFEAHRAEASCAVCHDLIDPIGYAMETLDGDGRMRTHYSSGIEIDASGEFIYGADASSFDGLGQLEGILAEEDAFESCMIEHWLSFATRRVPGELDECTLEGIEASVADQGGSLQELVRSTVLSDGFRYVWAGQK